jgi:hypothetical protein
MAFSRHCRTAASPVAFSVGVRYESPHYADVHAVKSVSSPEWLPRKELGIFHARLRPVDASEKIQTPIHHFRPDTDQLVGDRPCI